MEETTAEAEADVVGSVEEADSVESTTDQCESWHIWAHKPAPACFWEAAPLTRADFADLLPLDRDRLR